MNPDSEMVPQDAATSKAGVNWKYIYESVLKIMATILIGLPALAACIIIIAFFPPVAEHWLLFHPTACNGTDDLTRPVEGVKPEQVWFQNGYGNKLHGVIYKKAATDKVFLVSHGNAGNIEGREYLADFLLKQNCSVFMYDYAGFGKSDGVCSSSVAMDDVKAAYDCLTKKLGYSPKQVILFGESLGTAMTARLAGQVTCAGVVLECPVYSLKKIGMKLLPVLNLYPDWMWPAEALDTSKVLAGKHAPLLMIAGTADHTTWCDLADQLYALASGPKKYVRIYGAGHGDQVMMSSKEYTQSLLTFVNGLP